jgi:two-component system, NarL family, nitrate/nitrite response regulator NarL
MAIRCLIVDDSLRFAQAATELLMDEGMDVVGWAASGDEALRLAYELRPELALVDIELGGESGLELAGRLCTGEGGALARAVILISTHAQDEFAELIALSPALGFLAKSDLSADAISALLSNA